jgi:uncharacterized delta-60 repeat protein
MASTSSDDVRSSRFIIPAVSIAASLTSHPALSAPGDLDPTFGDVGRAQLPVDLEGAIWSLAVGDEGGVNFAGVDSDYCYYNEYCEVPFLGSVSDSGSSRSHASVRSDDVLLASHSGLIVRPDRQLVSLGYVMIDSSGLGGSRMAVAFIGGDGRPRESFANDGRFEFLTGNLTAAAQSGIVDSDGRIVVAGLAHLHSAPLVVLRLLPSGTLDESFGSAGVFRGPEFEFAPSVGEIVQVPGGYRLSLHATTGCRVVALTGSGTLDAGFGQLGSVLVQGRDASNFRCSALAAEGDGGLVIAGQDTTGPTVVRLRPDGEADPAFDRNGLPSALSDITALAVMSDGSVVAAGEGDGSLAGSPVARLRRDGRLDRTFGHDGIAWVEPATLTSGRTHIREILAIPGGSVLVGGSYDDGSQPLLARLLAGGGSPGVLSLQTQSSPVVEKDQRAVVRVHRTGGRTGAVSVGFATHSGSAVAGEDFQSSSGRLEWADGDASEREIVVPVNLDGAERQEQFYLTLTDPRAGAGLGRSRAEIVIEGDGYPAGLIELVAPASVVERAIGSPAFLIVRRADYAQGRVSVTLTATSGSAAVGDDVTLEAVDLTWEDGDHADRIVGINVKSDRTRESTETFSVALSSPTGGAVLGTSSATINILDLAQPKPASLGGGGHFGALGLALLGLAALARRAAIRLSSAMWLAVAAMFLLTAGCGGETAGSESTSAVGETATVGAGAAPQGTTITCADEELSWRPGERILVIDFVTRIQSQSNFNLGRRPVRTTAQTRFDPHFNIFPDYVFPDVVLQVEGVVDSTGTLVAESVMRLREPDGFVSGRIESVSPDGALTVLGFRIRPATCARTFDETSSFADSRPIQMAELAVGDVVAVAIRDWVSVTGEGLAIRVTRRPPDRQVEIRGWFAADATPPAFRVQGNRVEVHAQTRFFRGHQFFGTGPGGCSCSLATADEFWQEVRDPPYILFGVVEVKGTRDESGAILASEVYWYYI